MRKNRFVFGLLFLLCIVAASCAKAAEIVTCPTGQDSCGGACVPLASDSENCGKCGNVCPPTQACVAGACALTCPTGNVKCEKDGGPSLCVNAKTDNSNCGTCGKVCGSGQVCFGGTCSGTCGDAKNGQTVCGGDAGAPYCANLQVDRQNCGKCGVACTSDKLCVSGTCQGSCAPQQSVCGADGGAPFCASLMSDNANCGVCGAPCGTLEACVGGACNSLCAPSQKLCGGDGGSPSCVDALTDNKNCGSCGLACPSNKPVCAGGNCTTVGGGGTVRDVNGVISNVTYVKCGNGTSGNCTEPAAEASCTGIGLKLVSHASNGTSGVVSLGATVSCNWSVSYFTNNDAAVAGQCLVAISNAQWSSCCTLGSWHGNTLTVPVTLGQQFGYVAIGNSGYNGGLVNTSGSTWGCNPNATAVPAAGCSTYYVACK